MKILHAEPPAGDLGAVQLLLFREVKGRGQNADHKNRVSVERNLLRDDSGIGTRSGRARGHR